jgi:hypothetical protein
VPSSLVYVAARAYQAEPPIPDRAVYRRPLDVVAQGEVLAVISLVVLLLGRGRVRSG